jgi:hypothetical protein
MVVKLLKFEHALVRLLMPALIGFIFYGGWAFWANSEYGLTMAFKAAFIQGSYSFTITLVLALKIEWLFLRFKSWPAHLYLIGLISCSFLYLSSWSINYYAGTPNILLTILPGAAVSTVYTIIYIIGLNKLEKIKNNHV